MHPMELRHIRYFITLAEEMHFSRAARRLGISQPPLSQQIQALEHEVGIRLLDRSHHHVALTKAGEQFLTEAYKLFKQYDYFRQNASRIKLGEAGQLNLACVQSAFYEIMPPIIIHFRKTHPSVGISLNECTTSSAQVDLLAGRLDFAFIRINEVRAPLVVRRLRKERIIAAVPSGSRLAAYKKLTLRQLAEEPNITFQQTTSYQLYSDILQAFNECGVMPNQIYEHSSLDSVLGFVACGLGVALIPVSVSKLTMPGVTFRELRDKIAMVSISLVWHSKTSSVLTEKFMETVDKYY